MTNQDLYLPIELAKLIQPIAARLGVEADAGFYYDETKRKWVFLEAIGVEDIVIGFIPTYRADRLELLLPEWCFGLSLEDYIEVQVASGSYHLNSEIGNHISGLTNTCSKSRGPAKLKALAELILLLEKEKLL